MIRLHKIHNFFNQHDLVCVAVSEVTWGHAIYVVNIITVAIYHLDDTLFVAAV